MELNIKAIGFSASGRLLEKCSKGKPPLALVVQFILIIKGFFIDLIFIYYMN